MCAHMCARLCDTVFWRYCMQWGCAIDECVCQPKLQSDSEKLIDLKDGRTAWLRLSGKPGNRSNGSYCERMKLILCWWLILVDRCVVIQESRQQVRKGKAWKIDMNAWAHIERDDTEHSEWTKHSYTQSEKSNEKTKKQNTHTHTTYRKRGNTFNIEKPTETEWEKERGRCGEWRKKR